MSGFSREPFNHCVGLPDWAIGTFEKYAGNFGGGARNGSVLKKDGLLYYVYRGEFSIPDTPRFISLRNAGFGYAIPTLVC